MPKKAEKNERVLVALSGGVDSAVTAALLKKAGYNVTGVFVINYEGKNTYGEECWISEYRDAVRVAAHLDIPILRWNFAKEYCEQVLEYMFREYEAGRTPNPDVLCNKFIKFGAWLSRAREFGYDYLATGHYAKKLENQGIFSLHVPKDVVKDQTYFLHQLNQEQLAHSLFPLADYTKIEVRRLAEKFKLPVAAKEESMGICFIGEVPMKDFLEQRIPKKPGKVVLASGEVLGRHDGLPFYTIGQRHFSVTHASGDSRPLYIIAKRSETNELVVGHDDDQLLNPSQIPLTNIHWISGQAPVFPLKCEVRLRHRQELQACSVRPQGEQWEAECVASQRAVTPGQFAVFYKKGECLGGAVVA